MWRLVAGSVGGLDPNSVRDRNRGDFRYGVVINERVNVMMLKGSCPACVSMGFLIASRSAKMTNEESRGRLSLARVICS